MSIEKNMNARIQHKHDIEANWNKALNFIPKIGEIIIYDIDENHNYERIKIGDGITTVNNLDFLLDSKYISSDKADAVKKASGEIVSLTNSVHTPLYGFKLYGKTTQNGTPTPEAPVELVSAGEDGSVEVSVLGKNLLVDDLTGTYTGNGTNQIKTESINIIGGFLPNMQYTLRVDYLCTDVVAASSGNLMYWGIIYTDGSIAYNCGITSDTVNSKSLTYTTDANKTVQRITMTTHNRFTSGNIAINGIQISVGTEASDCEPYKIPETLTVSTPNGLAGIPVTSGGNYTDNNGQQWICDEVDFARGVYVQRIGKSTVNLALIYPQSNSPSYASFVTVGKINAVNFGVMSPVAVQIPNNNVALRSNGRITENAANCVFWGEAGDGEAELRSKYDGTELYYVLATPIETPLSAEQLQAYASLHTNEPNTTIMNDSNAGMEVKYYTPSTAVQMVHSPSDEGKILSIDEHGCVVLSEIDAGSIDIDLDGANNGGINSINADTLGGVPANNYVLKDELEGLIPDGSNNSSVLYTQQDLTEAQQAQVRENIGIDTYITACIEEALLGGEW